MTRLLQRRLGWGDVCASDEEVVEAVKQENVTKLKIVMPKIKHLIERGDYQLLPHLMKQPSPMIKDIECEHTFEHLFAGKCCRCEKVYDEKPFNKCQHCDLVFCISCRRIVEWETDKKELEIQEN